MYLTLYLTYWGKKRHIKCAVTLAKDTFQVLFPPSMLNSADKQWLCIKCVQKCVPCRGWVCIFTFKAFALNCIMWLLKKCTNAPPSRSTWQAFDTFLTYVTPSTQRTVLLCICIVHILYTRDLLNDVNKVHCWWMVGWWKRTQVTDCWWTLLLFIHTNVSSEIKN